MPPLHITDQAEMLRLMQQNISLNSLSSTVHASILDWGSNQSSSPIIDKNNNNNIPQHPDIILAADCVYFEPAFPLLLQTLTDMVGPETVCYFVFKKRRRADLGFVRLLRKGFDVGEVLDDPERETYQKENIFL